MKECGDGIDNEYLALCREASVMIVTCAECPQCAREYSSGDLNHRADCAYRPLGEMRYDEEGSA